MSNPLLFSGEEGYTDAMGFLGSVWRRVFGRRERTARGRLGLWGEDRAVAWLGRHGYKIMERRVRVGRHDEIDIVAESREGGIREMVFVEVKTRSSDRYGGGMAAMDSRKCHALSRAAMGFMRRFKHPRPPFRMDVIEVIGSPASDAVDIRHYRNAVSLEKKYGC